MRIPLLFISRRRMREGIEKWRNKRNKKEEVPPPGVQKLI